MKVWKPGFRFNDQYDSYLLSPLTLEDELQNVEMAEEERLKERLELKIKKRDYTGYDDDEFLEGNQGLMKRSVLAKYDEDIEGPRHSVSQFCKTSIHS